MINDSRKAKKARILFVCHFDPSSIRTVTENIELWRTLSDYDLVVHNTWPSSDRTLMLPAGLELGEFDGILIHSAVSYSFENLASLDTRLSRPFKDYDGVKILMKQDEQVKAGKVARYLRNARFDLLLTCVPDGELKKVYPASVVGDMAFLHTFTGYVSDTQKAAWDLHRHSKRPIDLSYRGSLQPLETGRLGYEKRKIGYDASAEASGLHLDISSRNEDRISGDAWLDFLGASKAVLGAESGSNLFDFDGKVQKWCAGYARRNRDVDPLSERYYLSAHEQYLHKFEGNVEYAQVSPRHFEAACAGAVQILYEGAYSGLLRPHEHFFPLKRDFSNWPEAIALIRDAKTCADMTERAYHDIALNPRLHYSEFVATFDRAVDSAFEKRGSLAKARSAR